MPDEFKSDEELRLLKHKQFAIFSYKSALNIQKYGSVQLDFVPAKTEFESVFCASVLYMYGA